MTSVKNPTDYTKGINVQPNPEMTRADHLKQLEQKLMQLYNSLDGWDEFGPDGIVLVYNIQRKLLIYREIYEILGDLAGECERFGLWCDARKKNEYEKYMMDNQRDGDPVKYKDIKANLAGKKYRINRDYFKGLSAMWERRRQSTLESINILKWLIRDAHEVGRGN